MPKARSLPGPAATPADRKRLQMADIARLADVSVATVSRALSGSPLVSPKTRDRIEALARAHDYAINVSAQNLRLRQNRTVAVVIPYDAGSRQPISDPFFLAMVGSLADALTERGYDMLLSRVDAENLESASRVVNSGVAIGVILIGQWRHHDRLNAMADRRVPIVVWGTRMAAQRYCTVGGDNVAGGALATQHLLDLGRRRIVFVGDPRLPEVAHRHRGYTERLQAAGVRPDPALLVDVPFDADRASAGIDALCARGVGFDAVFACSDVLASAAMRVLHRVDRPVPARVAVVGYDDIGWARHAYPPLTTVRQPIERAGVELVDALLRTVEGAVVAPRTLPVELVVRDSSGRATAAQPRAMAPRAAPR